MKSYKPNYLLTITFFIIFSLLSMIFPGMIMLLFLSADIKVFLIIPVILLMILIFVIIFNVIHFIICIFTKPRVFINDKNIEVRGKNNLIKSKVLDEIHRITIDIGEPARYSRGTPASISLFSEDYKNSLIIENPSFFMMIYVVRRCKVAKITIVNLKFYGIVCLIATLIVLFLGLFGII